MSFHFIDFILGINNFSKMMNTIEKIIKIKCKKKELFRTQSFNVIQFTQLINALNRLVSYDDVLGRRLLFTINRFIIT